MIDSQTLIQMNILEVLGLANAPEDIRNNALGEAIDIILESVVRRIKSRFSPEAITQYDHAFRDDGSEEEHMAFLATHASDLEKIIIEETMRYKFIHEVIASSS